MTSDPAQLTATPEPRADIRHKGPFNLAATPTGQQPLQLL